MSDLMPIGEIIKHHGVRGSLKVLPFFELKELLAHCRVLWLMRGEQATSFPVEGIRPGGRFLILKLQGVDQRETAERFRGWTLAVPREELPSLAGGRYYSFQLIGMTVITEGGEEVGKIDAIWPTPAHDIYRVVGEKGEVLIPAVKDFVAEIDMDRGRMVIRPPAGLLD